MKPTNNLLTIEELLGSGHNIETLLHKLVYETSAKSEKRSISIHDAAQCQVVAGVIEQLIEGIIDTEYEAEYSKLEFCDVCGDRMYSHAPDSHKEAGARELQKLQKARLQALLKGGTDE